LLQVMWSVQTNATLITDEWLELFEQYGVEVGVSLDGPRDIHDQRRKNWSGQGSFARSLLGVQRLKVRGIPFSLLCVLHEAALTGADDIFHFFADLAPSEVPFNGEKTEAAHLRGPPDTIAPKGASRDFSRRYWDLSARHGFPHEVREFRHIA